MQTLNGVTQYTREDLDREAKAVAQSHARQQSNGRAVNVSWQLLVSNDRTNLLVSYVANGKGNKCGVYHTSEAL